MTAILDTSFLFALTDRGDLNHQRVSTFAQSIHEELILPTAVLPEICYLLASRLGHQPMRRFVQSVTSTQIQVESTTFNDLVRVHEILTQYADSKIDFTDAAIVAIAERLSISRICTLDRRDFSIIRPKHCDYFELLPPAS
ncbi:MAG: PIN domain-containing protein [Cyanobacteria bacterium P01_A01_bin.17]